MNCACTNKCDINLTSHLESLSATLAKIQACLDDIAARLTALEGCVGDWCDEESIEDSDDEDEL